MYAKILKGAPLGNCNAISGPVGQCGAGAKGGGTGLDPKNWGCELFHCPLFP